MLPVGPSQDPCPPEGSVISLVSFVMCLALYP